MLDPCKTVCLFSVVLQSSWWILVFVCLNACATVNAYLPVCLCQPACIVWKIICPLLNV